MGLKRYYLVNKKGEPLVYQYRSSDPDVHRVCETDTILDLMYVQKVLSNFSGVVEKFKEDLEFIKKHDGHYLNFDSEALSDDVSVMLQEFTNLYEDILAEKEQE